MKSLVKLFFEIALRKVMRQIEIERIHPNAIVNNFVELFPVGRSAARQQHLLVV